MYYYKYEAVSTNEKFGKSYCTYYYHQDYGFVEMNYTTYDGEQILFKMNRFVKEAKDSEETIKAIEEKTNVIWKYNEENGNNDFYKIARYLM